MAKKAVSKKEVELAAEQIGKFIGPCEDGSRWTDAYWPKVKWPDDYSPMAQERIRTAAANALFAARKAR